MSGPLAGHWNKAVNEAGSSYLPLGNLQSQMKETHTDIQRDDLDGDNSLTQPKA